MPPGPAAPPELSIVVYPEQIEYILATIRHLESRDNYLAPPNAGNASGAYQFIRSTWNNYGGYEHAYLAPPAVQDERAALDVTRFLAQFNNDVSMIPVMWYYPIAASQPEWMDRVPGPQFGNRLTIREYQTLWLRNFSRISGTTIAPRVGEPLQAVPSLIPGAPPVLPTSEGDPSLSFPVLGPSNLILPECDSDESSIDDVATPSDASWVAVTSFADIHEAGRCAAQTPGVITGAQLQPVLAVADGVITNVHDEPGSGDPISITLTDASGTSFVYSGFNDDNPGTDDGNAPEHLRLSGLAEVGRTVRAGQVIGFMGNSAALPDQMQNDPEALDGVTTPPHVQVRSIDLNGDAVDTYGPIVDAMFRQTCQVMIGPWSGTAHGDGHEPVLVAAADRTDGTGSAWVISETGQVTATGWAAMVNPGEACTSTPAEMFGPGAGGVEEGLAHWLTPIDLPTETWVAISMHDDLDTRGVVLR
ncbi:M23 family metallopeptidase [Ilumatobacter nonamiensis]|uniref:M23 family metallopeptidase n=1 Tax=Ilumatobacter nonamiensis TaxID=467093 RepID=UPI0006843978|nr:transglycosylase family protein [Ilumatobacter nonamiensis]